MRTCHIVGAGDFNRAAFAPAEEDYIIAVDAGIRHCPRYDVAVGDFDSLGYVPQGGEVIRHPVMKDDTDMMLAVKIAAERGFTRLLLHGGVGGRADHTVANYHALAYLARRDIQAVLVGMKGCAACLQNGNLVFPPRPEGILSVFAWGGPARGVTLEGLLYPLTDGQLTCDTPLGVSNEFIGPAARVGVREGMLLVMWEGMDMPEFAP